MATASTPKAKAIVIGATGACGAPLLNCLLKDEENFESVVVFSRKDVKLPEGVASDRLKNIVNEFDKITEEEIKEACAGCTVIFNCLGSSRSQAGSKAAFYRIDYDLALKFMKAAKEVEVPYCSLLTSKGADHTSFFHYMRTKGELENAVRELNFKHLSIFRPGLLDRGTERRRTLERIVLFFTNGMPVETVAKAMAIDACNVIKSPPEQESVFDDNGIRELVFKAEKKTEPTADSGTGNGDPAATADSGAGKGSDPAAAADNGTGAVNDPPTATTQEEDTGTAVGNDPAATGETSDEPKAGDGAEAGETKDEEGATAATKEEPKSDAQEDGEQTETTTQVEEEADKDKAGKDEATASPDDVKVEEKPAEEKPSEEEADKNPPESTDM